MNSLRISSTRDWVRSWTPSSWSATLSWQWRWPPSMSSWLQLWRRALARLSTESSLERGSRTYSVRSAWWTSSPSWANSPTQQPYWWSLISSRTSSICTRAARMSMDWCLRTWLCFPLQSMAPREVRSYSTPLRMRTSSGSLRSTWTLRTKRIRKLHAPAYTSFWRKSKVS